MEVVRFENERWRSHTQKKEFRHHAAVALIKGGSVLDVGCGDGLLLKMLAEKGARAEGADISPEAVLRCTEAGLVARELTDLERLPYEDASFDCVVLLDVLEHVYDPAALLAEATRIAREAVVISVPNFSSLPARLQVLSGQVPENNRPNKAHLYWFNFHVLRALVEKAGLRISDLRMNTFSPAGLLGAFLPRLFPNMFALSFVARCDKLPVQ